MRNRILGSVLFILLVGVGIYFWLNAPEKDLSLDNYSIEELEELGVRVMDDWVHVEELYRDLSIVYKQSPDESEYRYFNWNLTPCNLEETDKLNILNSKVPFDDFHVYMAGYNIEDASRLGLDYIYLKDGRNISEGQFNEIVISEITADYLSVGVGDNISTPFTDYLVVGIYEKLECGNTPEVVMHLNMLKQVLARQGVKEEEMAYYYIVKSEEDREQMERRLNGLPY